MTALDWLHNRRNDLARQLADPNTVVILNPDGTTDARILTGAERQATVPDASGYDGYRPAHAAGLLALDRCGCLGRYSNCRCDEGQQR